MFRVLRAPQLPGQRPKDRLPLPKFSQLVKRMVLEIDRNPGAYPDGNVAEVRLPNPRFGGGQVADTHSVAQSTNASTTDGWFHITQNW